MENFYFRQTLEKQNAKFNSKKVWEEKCKIVNSKISLGSKIHNF
jgi:hypothetical protein